MKKCPVCSKKSLVKKTFEDLTFYQCSLCKGVLFDKKQLGNLTENSVTNLSVPSNSVTTGRTCPHCPDNSMHQFYYPQTYVTVDMCKRCSSLWLDQGEIDEIQLVRNKLKEDGKLETYVPDNSIKAALLRFVDSSIKALSSF